MALLKDIFLQQINCNANQQSSAHSDHWRESGYFFIEKILNLIDFRHIARLLHALFIESCSTGHIRAGIDQIGKA